MKQYEICAKIFHRQKDAKAHLDVMPRMAFLIVNEDPEKAMALMKDALRLSKIIGRQYYMRTLNEITRLQKQ